MDFGLEILHFGLWNITDVLEFPSTLMEQRTLDAGGVLSKKFVSCLSYPGCGWFVAVIMDWDMLQKPLRGFLSDI